MSILHTALNVVFSACPKRRLRIARSLLAASIYLGGFGVGEYAISQWSSINAEDVRAFEWAALVFSLLTYVLIRSGLSERLEDPSLTSFQIIVAQSLAAWCYTIFPPIRGALLTLQVVVIFFALFKLNSREQLLVTIYPALLLGWAMWHGANSDPAVFTPSVEVIHFAILITLLPALGVLGHQLASMRHKVTSQKIELEQALKRIQNLAHHDELTGLNNRRFMLDALRQQMKRSDRGGMGFCLALIDLDHFKQVNDSHGHQIGDLVLRTFAEKAQLCLRETDLLARWGGEEFLLLLPETKVSEASITVHRIRDALSHHMISPNAPNLRAKFSAGITRFVQGDTIDTAMERADAALYEAKQSGRDQTAFA